MTFERGTLRCSGHSAKVVGMDHRLVNEGITRIRHTMFVLRKIGHITFNNKLIQIRKKIICPTISIINQRYETK